MDSFRIPYFTKTRTKIITLLIIVTISALLISLLIHISNRPSSRSLSFINDACSHTLYPSLCRSSLSTLSNSTDLLEFALYRAISRADAARVIAAEHLSAAHQHLTPPEESAARDCRELLDQTLYELESAMDDLASLPSSSPISPTGSSRPFSAPR